MKLSQAIVDGANNAAFSIAFDLNQTIMELESVARAARVHMPSLQLITNDAMAQMAEMIREQMEAAVGVMSLHLERPVDLARLSETGPKLLAACRYVLDQVGPACGYPRDCVCVSCVCARAIAEYEAAGQTQTQAREDTQATPADQQGG